PSPGGGGNSAAIPLELTPQELAGITGSCHGAEPVASYAANSCKHFTRSKESRAPGFGCARATRGGITERQKKLPAPVKFHGLRPYSLLREYLVSGRPPAVFPANFEPLLEPPA